MAEFGDTILLDAGVPNPMELAYTWCHEATENAAADLR
jgi:hypothetical protein